MKNKIKLPMNEYGFSLVEMMVSFAVFVLLILAAASTFNSSQKLMNWNQYGISVQEELRRVLNTMSREMRESSPSSPTPITIGTDAITFEIPLTVSQNVVTAWTQISYGLNPDNTVTRTVNGETTIIGNSVTNLNFTYNPQVSPRTVRIEITGNKAAGSTTLDRDITMTLTGEVTLRNG